MKFTLSWLKDHLRTKASVEEISTIYWTIIACVGVSILVHGFSARPAMETLPDDADT